MSPNDHSTYGMQRPADDQTQPIIRLLLECATVGIGFLDRENSVRYANPTLALINGRAASDIIGRPLAEVAPRAAPIIAEHCRQVLASGRPVRNVEYTRPAEAADPARTWLADFFAVRGPDQAIVGVGLIVIEITERQLADEARRRPIEPAIDDLQTALRDAQAYTHRINHQLALAVGYAELLAASGELEGAARQYLRQVVSAVSEVAQTVVNLRQAMYGPFSEPRRSPDR